MSILNDLLLLLASILIALTAGILSTWYVWNNQLKNSSPLHDILFDILWDWSHITTPYVNIIVVVQYIIGIIAYPKEIRWKIVAQFIFLQCIITFVRSITVSVTLLPNIHIYPYCEVPISTFWEALGNMLTHGTCADYMFSGHTATSFLAWLFVNKYANTYASIFVGVCTDVVIVLLILQRWHYTVDIVIAIIIIWLLFVFYEWHQDLYKSALREAKRVRAYDVSLPTWIESEGGKERLEARRKVNKYNYWFYFNSFELTNIKKEWNKREMKRKRRKLLKSQWKKNIIKRPDFKLTF